MLVVTLVSQKKITANKIKPWHFHSFYCLNSSGKVNLEMRLWSNQTEYFIKLYIPPLLSVYKNFPYHMKGRKNIKGDDILYSISDYFSSSLFILAVQSCML